MSMNQPPRQRIVRELRHLGVHPDLLEPALKSVGDEETLAQSLGLYRDLRRAWKVLKGEKYRSLLSEEGEVYLGRLDSLFSESVKPTLEGAGQEDIADSVKAMGSVPDDVRALWEMRPTKETPHLEYLKDPFEGVPDEKVKGIMEEFAILQISKGCSHARACRLCALDAGTRIETMPYGMILKILRKGEELGVSRQNKYLFLFNDSEPFDYRDALYDADLSDVVVAVNESGWFPEHKNAVFVTTAGWRREDRVAQRAAERMGKMPHYLWTQIPEAQGTDRDRLRVSLHLFQVPPIYTGLPSDVVRSLPFEHPVTEDELLQGIGDYRVEFERKYHFPPRSLPTEEEGLSRLTSDVVAGAAKAFEAREIYADRMRNVFETLGATGYAFVYHDSANRGETSYWVDRILDGLDINRYYPIDRSDAVQVSPSGRAKREGIASGSFVEYAYPGGGCLLPDGSLVEYVNDPERPGLEMTDPDTGHVSYQRVALRKTGIRAY